MDPRANYRTKQREMLIGYLESVPGVHITAGNVCEYFRSHGTPISQATVYRQLEKLVGEGVLNKYIIDANSPACFEYIGHQEHCCEPVCFHCKCEKCGVLIHLHCDELEGIAAHLKEHHRFILNPMRTVFYGICDQCAKTEKESQK